METPEINCHLAVSASSNLTSNTIKKERSASPWALDPEPLYKMGALRRPLGFPVPHPECRSQSVGIQDAGRAMRTGRLTRAPRDPVLVQKIVAPTRASQAYSAPIVAPLPDGSTKCAPTGPRRSHPAADSAVAAVASRA